MLFFFVRRVSRISEVKLLEGRLDCNCALSQVHSYTIQRTYHVSLDIVGHKRWHYTIQPFQTKMSEFVLLFPPPPYL